MCIKKTNAKLKRRNNYKEFAYTDDLGNPLYKKVIKNCKRNYEFREYYKNNSWSRGQIATTPNVLYNAVSINAQIKKYNKIYWVQDELSADTLKQLGIVATTVIGGNHGKITENIKQQLKGVDIVILKINRSLSNAYSKRIKKNLESVANSIKIIDLSNKFVAMNYKSIADLVNVVKQDTYIKRVIRDLENATAPSIVTRTREKKRRKYYLHW